MYIIFLLRFDSQGILWAVSLTKYIASCVYYDDTEYLTAPEGYNPIYSNNMAIEALGLGFVSLCLTLVNISCIFLTGLIVLKVCNFNQRED